MLIKLNYAYEKQLMNGLKNILFVCETLVFNKKYIFNNMSQLFTNIIAVKNTYVTLENKNS